MRRIVLLMVAFVAILLAAAEPAPERVAIPFDFESKFDNGRYGQMIGDMVWKKLQRQGGFILPESMQEVRDWCERNQARPGPTTPLAKLKEMVREQAGHVAIWGKVERVAGHETDVYDLWIYVADFSTDPPRMIYEKKARTETVSEIPHTYVKEALDKLYGRVEQLPPGPDPIAEERWRTGPNLVTGGDFEKGRGAVPLGWTSPLPQYVFWEAEKGTSKPNRVLRFTFPGPVAETTGVLFYSDFFPVEEGATYRFQCRYRTTGAAVKVFVKCYDEVRGRFTRPGEPLTQRREVYRSQQNLKGGAGVWNVQTEDFVPAHTNYTPRWGKVMLYAYYPAGTVEWDDVVVKQIKPAPPRQGEKERRPSLETKVHSKEVDLP